MTKHSPKILVADDHAVIRRTLAAVLTEELDASVELASDGDEALAKLRTQPDVEIAVLDISMPGRTGLEVLRAIRHQGLATGVIVISAHSADMYAERARRFGADAFIQKEQVGERLVPCIQGLLNHDGEVCDGHDAD